MKPCFDDAQPSLTTDCTKNCCNRTFFVEIIVENIVTFLRHSVMAIRYIIRYVIFFNSMFDIGY